MVSKKAKVIFLMPPKTASNSIKNCLLDSSIDFDEFPEYYPAPQIHLFLSELIGVFRIEDWEEYKVIQVVRDPITRFISSYYHQLNIIPKNANGVKLVGMSFDEFAHHLYDCLLGDNFIADFYGNYEFVQKAARSGKSWGGSRTYLNQIQWNDMGANVKYIKLEDIAQDISILSDELGVYLPELDKINTNKSNKSESDYQTMITADIKKIVDDIFYQDFIKLGYERPK